jgi:hypothetical protein
MKLTKAMVSKKSNILSTSNNKNKAVQTEITADVMKWLLDESARKVFFAWLLDNSKPVKDETELDKKARQQATRDFQNIVNQTTFQRAYFDIPKGEKLDKELRVKKAKQTMVTSGLATPEQLDSGEFYAFTRDLDVKPKTLIQALQKVKDDYNASTTEIVACANQLD